MNQFTKPENEEHNFMSELEYRKNQVLNDEKQYIDKYAKLILDTLNSKIKNRETGKINLNLENLKNTMVTMRIQNNMNYQEVADSIVAMYQVYFE